MTKIKHQSTKKIKTNFDEMKLKRKKNSTPTFLDHQFPPRLMLTLNKAFGRCGTSARTSRPKILSLQWTWTP